MRMRLLNGAQTLGQGIGFWSASGVARVSAVAFGVREDPFEIGNASYFRVWVFMALGLCLMWGYGGILSFGQTAFFG